MFDHQRMKAASAIVLDSRADSSTSRAHEKLRRVAQIFLNLQQARHLADYDVQHTIDPGDAGTRVLQAIEAFQVWKEIKDEDVAQDYLYSLLFKDRTP